MKHVVGRSVPKEYASEWNLDRAGQKGFTMWDKIAQAGLKGIAGAAGQALYKNMLLRKASVDGPVLFSESSTILEAGDWVGKEGYTAVTANYVFVCGSSKSSFKSIDLKVPRSQLLLEPKRGKVLFFWDGYSFLFSFAGKNYELGVYCYDVFMRVLGRERFVRLGEHPDLTAIFDRPG